MGSERRPVRTGDPGDGASSGRPGSNPRQAWAAALRALARRPRSAREIEALLRERFDDEAVVEATMARLVEARLLDDGAVAGAVLRDAARRGLGSRRVRQVLARRGVAPEAVPGADATGAHDFEAARALVERRFPAGAPSDPKGRARALRMLASRGFPASVARRLLGIDHSLDDDPAEAGDD
ncbi:recombination regulator RecX [bacterium]|nr:recombination regulator RecX [bacterium]